MRITQQAMQEVHQHAGEGYPNEVCGLLVAARGTDLVTRAHRMRNMIVERSRDRYQIDPQEQMRVSRTYDAEGLSVVGYYHSHPDHPAQASPTDERESFGGAFYLIVSCHKGTVVAGNVFVAEQDGGPMRLAPLDVVDQAG